MKKKNDDWGGQWVTDPPRTLDSLLELRNRFGSRVITLRRLHEMVAECKVGSEWVDTERWQRLIDEEIARGN